jgi:hypothetical protein
MAIIGVLIMGIIVVWIAYLIDRLIEWAKEKVDELDS